MKKTMSKLGVILAVGMMFAGSAYAGVNGCFQFYKTSASTFALLDPAATITTGNGAVPTGNITQYVGADCTTFGATVNGVTPGQALSKVAYELTKSYQVNLASLNGGALADSILYVSTTDIPGASRLTFTLSNATWQEAVMYLLAWDPTAQAGAGGWVQVAATDGIVNNQAGATFLFQSGTPVTAGTKLFISNVAGAGSGAAAAFVSPKIKVANTNCAASAATNVTINVTAALTDASQNIAGARTETSGQLNTLVSAPQQFSITMPATVVAAEVNVEPPSLRRNFKVVDSASTTVADSANLTFSTAKIIFGNTEANTASAALLDKSYNLVAGDLVVTKFYADKGIDSFVKAQLYAETTPNTSQYNIINGFPDTLGTPLNAAVNNAFFDIGASAASATAYNVVASGLYPALGVNAPVTQAAFAIVTTTDATKVMPYNYTVSTDMTLDFAAATMLDNCTATKSLIQIGINGAVFKVPYIYFDSNTFIRVSNEDTTDALIFADFFEGGLECTNVPLGTVNKKASNLMKGDALVTAIGSGTGTGACAALAAGIGPNLSGRYFGTFTVTAPKDKVHAFGVQKVPAGTDRVLTILDQNSWNQ
jgi:hypothetical protein